MRRRSGDGSAFAWLLVFVYLAGLAGVGSCCVRDVEGEGLVPVGVESPVNCYVTSSLSMQVRYRATKTGPITTTRGQFQNLPSTSPFLRSMQDYGTRYWEPRWQDVQPEVFRRWGWQKDQFFSPTPDGGWCERSGSACGLGVHGYKDYEQALNFFLNFPSEMPSWLRGRVQMTRWGECTVADAMDACAAGECGSILRAYIEAIAPPPVDPPPQAALDCSPDTVTVGDVVRCRYSYTGTPEFTADPELGCDTNAELAIPEFLCWPTEPGGWSVRLTVRLGGQVGHAEERITVKAASRPPAEVCLSMVEGDLLEVRARSTGEMGLKFCKVVEAR